MRKSLVLCTLLLVNPMVSWAQTHNVQLKLKALQVEQAQEKRGDELYFSITEFTPNHRALNLEFPEFPSHWLSTHLNNFKEMTIWHESMASCEPKELLVTLVEKDSPPWDLDDTLGTVKLNLLCESGKLRASWSIPQNEMVTAIPLKSIKQNAFYFNGSNGKYRVEFELDSTALPVIKK